jgi:hypothetical protein
VGDEIPTLGGHETGGFPWFSYGIRAGTPMKRNGDPHFVRTSYVNDVISIIQSKK